MSYFWHNYIPCSALFQPEQITPQRSIIDPLDLTDIYLHIRTYRHPNQLLTSDFLYCHNHTLNL